MSNDEVKELISYLAQRLFHIENYYLIYCELGLHRNKSVNQDTSKAYLSVINQHKGFFLPVEESLRGTLTIELCSFVVAKERKYKSLGRVIDELKKLPEAPDLSGSYNELVNKHKNIIAHIEKFRNQYYAHKSFADLLKLPSSSDQELRELFVDLKNLLNVADSYFGNVTWFMDDDSSEAVIDTHLLMDNLLRGEVQRTQEINLEYISESYRSGRRDWLGLNESYH